MKSNYFTVLRFIAALITVAAIIGKPYLPRERLTLYPGDNTASYLYGAVNSAGQDEYGWLDQEENSWWCYHEIDAASCGINMVWGPPPVVFDNVDQHPPCQRSDSDEDGDGWGWENEASCKVVATPPAKSEPSSRSSAHSTTHASPDRTASGIDDSTIDFSRFDGMNVKIHYEGKAKYLELFIRQQIDTSPTPNAGDAGKFMSVFLRTDDLKAGPAYIDLSEFSVAEWWILTTNAPRELALPEFDKIRSIGVAHIEYGMHKMRIDGVELVGEHISTKNFLLAILIFWCLFLSIEAALRYYWLYKASRQHEALITNLTSTAESLEEEKHQLKNLATTDALTGALNREGVRQYLENEYGGEYLPLDFGVLLIDIDHFKQINDTHGHDVGDTILKAMTERVAANIRNGDIFARWGGEEFLLLSREYNDDGLLILAEKLRTLVAEQTLEPALNLHITISIGVAKVRSGESFSMTLKRADIALYQAKRTRNCVAQEK